MARPHLHVGGDDVNVCFHMCVSIADDISRSSLVVKYQLTLYHFIQIFHGCISTYLYAGVSVSIHLHGQDMHVHICTRITLYHIT